MTITSNYFLLQCNKKWLPKYVPVAILLVLLISNQGWAQKNYQKAIFEITVLDSSLNHISTNIKVCIHNTTDGKVIQCDTTKNGVVSFEMDPSIPYYISTSNKEYKPNAKAILLNKYNSISRDTILLKPYDVVLTLMVVDEKNKSVTSQVTVTLLENADISTQQIIAINEMKLSQMGNHNFVFGIEKSTTYQAIVSAEGYRTNTMIIHTTDNPSKIQHQILLKAIKPKDTLITPVDKSDFHGNFTFYFDHDTPSHTYKIQEVTMSDLVKNYKSQKANYLSISQNNLDSNKFVIYKDTLMFFFDLKLDKSIDKFDTAMQNILEMFEKGNSIAISLSAHYSDIGSWSYNHKLSNRRIQVMKNDILRYNGGVFKNYMDLGKLTFELSVQNSKNQKQSKTTKIKNRFEAIYSRESIMLRRVDVNIKTK